MKEKNVMKIIVGILALLLMFVMISAVDDGLVDGVYSFVEDVMHGEIIGNQSYCTFEMCYLYEGESFVIGEKTISVGYLTQNEFKLEINGDFITLEQGEYYQLDGLIGLNTSFINYEGKEDKTSYVVLEFSKTFSGCNDDNLCRIYEYPGEYVYAGNTIAKKIFLDYIDYNKVRMSFANYNEEEREIFGSGYYSVGESFVFEYYGEEYLIKIENIYYNSKESDEVYYVDFSINEIREEPAPIQVNTTISYEEIECEKECKLYYGKNYKIDGIPIKLTLAYENKVYLIVGDNEEMAYELNTEILSFDDVFFILSDINAASSFDESYIILEKISSLEYEKEDIENEIEKSKVDEPVPTLYGKEDSEKQNEVVPEDIVSEKTFWEKIIDWFNRIFG